MNTAATATTTTKEVSKSEASEKLYNCMTSFFRVDF